MREFYFPSGIPVTDFDATPWIRALEILYAVLLIGAVGVFVWRCTRKVALYDIYFWIAFIAMECLLAWAAARYFQAVQDRFSPWQVWTPPLLSTIGLAFIAANVTMVRGFNRLGNAVFLLLETAVLWQVFTPRLGMPREAAFRTHCKGNLKQIGLAMHNFSDQDNAFPAAGGMMPDGNELWTWRMAILPYIDQQSLSKEFHHDELWDSPHNSTLQPKRPATYACPSHSTSKRFTTYAMPRGIGAIGGDGVTPVFIKNISDGTSNTLLVVEACGRDIIWTEPKDVEVTDQSLGVNLPGNQPGQSRGIISSYHVGGGHALFADGSVRLLSEKIDPAVLKILTTKDGGEMTPQF